MNKNVKIKSRTTAGFRATTRASIVYIEDSLVILFKLLYFSNNNNEEKDTCVRTCKNIYVYKREWSIKLDTLMNILTQLSITTKESENTTIVSLPDNVKVRDFELEVVYSIDDSGILLKDNSYGLPASIGTINFDFDKLKTTEIPISSLSDIAIIINHFNSLLNKLTLT